MPRIALAFLIASFAGSVGVARAQCPPNYVGSFLTTPSGTPIVASVHRDSMCNSPHDCRWHSSWDHAAGQAACDANTACFTEVPDAGDVGQFTADDYVLTGPASPNPISFVVQMHVSGTTGQGCTMDCSSGICQTVCNYGSLSASLKEGAQTSSAPSAPSLNTNLQLSLAKSVGEHFQLGMKLQARAACNALAQVAYDLTFFLPPEYGVTSCYGYSMPAPTAALRASWGRLKTLYR